jgi:uroporphyrin-III C-methyltransferase
MSGRVYLVGAGPGDPGLVTARALELISQADVILYDRLIGDAVLTGARVGAELVFVGKRGGGESMPQERIEALMVAHANAGRDVVRLKGGDPFVFGRGGEEALALQHAGISYDVVPGVTSAIAAPASAGIPVTHRGVASAFLVVSGHEEEAFASAIAALQPNGITVVVLMGLGRSAAIACHLIDRGWSRSTPAAIIVDASRPQQQVWRGTLEALVRDEVAMDGSGAGTLVIGDVVAIGLQEANRSPERLALQANRSPERLALQANRSPERLAIESTLGGLHVSRG